MADKLSLFVLAHLFHPLRIPCLIIYGSCYLRCYDSRLILHWRRFSGIAATVFAVHFVSTLAVLTCLHVLGRLLGLGYSAAVFLFPPSLPLFLSTFRGFGWLGTPLPFMGTGVRLKHFTAGSDLFRPVIQPLELPSPRSRREARRLFFINPFIFCVSSPSSSSAVLLRFGACV